MLEQVPMHGNSSISILAAEVCLRRVGDHEAGTGLNSII